MAKKSAPPPYLVGPLTAKSFKRERKAAVNQKFRPLQREVNSELGASDLTTARIPGYFQQYQQNLANLQSGTQAAYDKANQNFQGLINTAGQQSTAQQGQIQQRAQADAALRGTDVNPSVAADSVNGAAARQRATAAIGGSIAGQGANQYAYLADKQRIAGGEEINQLGAEAAHKVKLRDDARSLAAERGDFKAGYKTTARDDERKFYLSNKTIGGENFRAKLSAKTSSQNNKRSTSTSAANNQRSTSTSAKNNRRSTTTSSQNNQRSTAQSNTNSLRAHKKKKK